MSLRSFQDVGKYKQVLEEKNTLKSIADLTNEIARALEAYWNDVAIPLGRLEGMVESYMRSNEFRVIAKYVSGIENYFKRFLELREDYSRLSHDFLFEVVYDDGYGLQFLAMLTGVKLGQIQDVARKTKSAVTMIDLLEEMAKIRRILSDTHVDHLSSIVGTMMTVEDFLEEAGLESVWDMGSVNDFEEGLVHVGSEIEDVLTEIIFRVIIYLETCLDGDCLEPEDQEYYEDFAEIVERFGRMLPSRQ
jgi:hypothetical protein